MLVLMTRVEVAPPLPGMTLGEVKAQLEFAGSPEQDNPTALLKLPPWGVRVTEKDADCPLRMEALDGEAEIEKSTPVPVRLTV